MFSLQIIGITICYSANIVTSSVLPVHGRSRRHHHHHTTNPQENRTRQLSQIYQRLLANFNSEWTFPMRVAFSKEKPHLPPWPLDEAMATGLSRLELAMLGKQNRTSYHRAKRDIAGMFGYPACQSDSEWTLKIRARDIFNQEVYVLQDIDVGGIRVNQYIYETRCRHVDSACRGIDTRRYSSSCKNNYISTYARVRNLRGEEGWHMIRIRGYCNCVLTKKSTYG